jgi:hypothetical protein
MRMRISRRSLRWAVSVVGVLVLLVALLPLTLPASLRTRLASAIGDRFGGTVEIRSLRVSVFPRLRLAGSGVVVRHGGRTDVPPLITIKAFSADAGIVGLLRRTIRLREVRLQGLEVNVPPGGLDVDRDGDRDSRDDGDDSDDGGDLDESPLIVDELRSEGAVLRILRRTPGKAPREWVIEHLSMQDTGATTPWAFAATLTNPTPPGRIHARGTFGPWNAGAPSVTPLAASYEFVDADLGHFDGIRGMLRSEGAFKGVLERIEVEGRAEVPDFALADVGRAVPLKTTFHAVVDGTNGNTLLQPVEATLGETVVHASGGVVEDEEDDGRTIRLDIVIDRGRIEDVLALAVKSEPPPMTGALVLRAKFELPPGDASGLEKLQLSDGEFTLATARFPSGGVQAKVNELSQKAQGEGDTGAPEEVASDFTGRFEMRDGAIRFSRVGFVIPGARVNLAGAYAVEAEALDFRGSVTMDAKLSELTTGTKSVLLKLIEPLFRRGHVTVVPVTIGGTVDQPKFGLDVKRALTRD